MSDPLTSMLLETTPVVTGASWFIIILCLLGCALFSGLEIAFLSANKLRIELRSKQGNYVAKILSGYLKRPDDFISTVLVANNLALVIYGIYMGEVLNSYANLLEHTWFGFLVASHFVRFFLVTLISTFIVLFTAEFLPKSLFRINPDYMLFSLALPFRFFQFLLWPIIAFVKISSAFLLRIFTNTEVTENMPVYTKVDLDNYISSLEHTGQAEHTELNTEIFRNALDFSAVKVRDFMVPRTELVALEINDPVKQLRELFISSSHSKIVIYRDSIDNIIGFVHHSELLDQPKDILSILKPVHIVSENTQAHDLLRDFIQQRKSIAAVVDEFGGTAGIATLEDVIEEIFGEIEDEFDTEDLTETRVNERHFIFSARLEIWYLNEKYDLGLPEGDYSTLGGFVINEVGKIPRPREVFRIGKYELIILKAKGPRVEEVEFIIHDDD